MIHVRISLSYRNIPFEIEIEGTTEHSTQLILETEELAKLLASIRKFIDANIKAEVEAKYP